MRPAVFLWIILSLMSGGRGVCALDLCKWLILHYTPWLWLFSCARNAPAFPKTDRRPVSRFGTNNSRAKIDFFSPFQPNASLRSEWSPERSRTRGSRPRPRSKTPQWARITQGEIRRPHFTSSKDEKLKKNKVLMKIAPFQHETGIFSSSAGWKKCLNLLACDEPKWRNERVVSSQI